MKNHRSKTSNNSHINRAEPILHQKAPQVQSYKQVLRDVPLGLPAKNRQEMTGHLNQILADILTLRDLYKKSHWQVSGPTFYQLHLLFDKHYEQQSELVDLVAERIQILGGVSIAMAHDVAETTGIPRPPRDREEVPAQISRLLEAHELLIKEARSLAHKAQELQDDGTNDLLVSDVLRANELQAWFLYEHLVNLPLVMAQ